MSTAYTLVGKTHPRRRVCSLHSNLPIRRPRVPACPPVFQPDDKVSYPMTNYTKIPLDRVFVSPSTPSFSELIDQLQINDAITSARRKEQIWGLRRVAEALNPTPV